MVADPGSRQTFFQNHPWWSLTLVAVPSILHFIIQSRIYGSMRRFRGGNFLARALRPTCIVAVGFVAGLAEAAVADILFLGCFS